MPTSLANLSTTEYVKVNYGLSDVILQAHRDTVRIAFSDVKPSRDNTAFHQLNGGDAPLILGKIVTGVWVLAMTNTASLVITENIEEVESFKSAFGETLAVINTPVIQISSRYGLNGVLTAELGGSSTVVDGMYTVSTGTGANNVAAIISQREVTQRPGQGLSGIFPAIFSEGVPNNLQQAGVISSESAFAFGYDNEDFGVLYASEGALEVQELQVTTPASVNENVNITLDDIAYVVPITSGTAEQNAYEIATYLQQNEPRYRITSNGDTVYVIANLPDFGTGVFSFTGGTSSAVWSEITNQVIPDEVWVPKSQWNVNPNFDIDPQTLNEFKVQVQGDIKYYIKDTNTGHFELVHILKYLNSNTKPSIENPTFRMGWATRNRGNTTDIKVQGHYANGSVEGELIYNQLPVSDVNIQDDINNVRRNVIGFRNRTIFNDKANRAEIIPKLISLATDSTKLVLFEIIANPETDTFLEWEYLDEQRSLMEVCKSNSIITGGDLIATFVVTSLGKDIDMEDILTYHVPGAEFCITARLAQSGTAASMVATGTWQEDI